MEIQSFINDYKLQDTLPKLWLALRTMMIIPLTSANCEGSFSKLQITKTYLQSIIAEECLKNLEFISAKNGFVSELDFNEVIQFFADLKSRKTYLK